MRSSWLCLNIIFDHPAEGRGGGECLLQLQQGIRTTAEYALTVAASSGSNEPVFRTLFRSGLCEEVQMELACRETTSHWTHSLRWPSTWITFSGSVRILITSLPPFAEYSESEPDPRELGGQHAFLQQNNADGQS